MSITQTVLVFVGIPAVVIAAVFAVVFGATARRSSKRYRPGRPFTFSPVWFVAAPGDSAEARANSTAHELTAGERVTASSLSASAARQERVSVPAQHGQTGGASDSW